MFFSLDFLLTSFSFFKKRFFLFYFTSLFLKQVLENFILVIRFHFYAFELITFKNVLFPLILFLQKSLFFQFNQLIDIVTRDYLQKLSNFRFGVTYVLFTAKYNLRFLITVFLNEFDSVISITKLFQNANQHEREVWDLYGLFFLAHPDLRRILTDYGFQYFPFRKDFPLSGFDEIIYNDKKKKLIYAPISFLQDYRFFSLKSKQFNRS